MNPSENTENIALDDPEAFRLILLNRLSEAKTKTLEDSSSDKNETRLLEIVFNQSSFLLGRFSTEFKNQIDLMQFNKIFPRHLALRQIALPV